MESILVTQLIDEALTNVNVSVVVALMAIGFIIKHFKFLDKFNVTSDIIPPVLLLCSIAAMTITDGFNVSTIISAVVNAAVAIGLHQQGKNIFTVTVIPSISKLFSGLISKDEPSEEKSEEEMVDDIIDEVLKEEESEEDTDI